MLFGSGGWAPGVRLACLRGRHHPSVLERQVARLLRSMNGSEEAGSRQGMIGRVVRRRLSGIHEEGGKKAALSFGVDEPMRPTAGG